MRDFSDIGAIHVRLTAPEIRRLYATRDPRILSVVANRPIGGPALSNSTVLVNMPSAWNAGYRAAGQYIVVMDTGINKNHAMFQMNGATKITHEGCYGSNTSDRIYQSICPSAQPNGDSNFGTPNSGAPTDNYECAANIREECSHGTHVAGIAAGRASSSLNLQGVAPDAYLVSMQVFSQRISYPNLRYFNADLLAALGDTLILGTSLAGPNPVTVNMSLDGPLFAGNCPAADTAISNRVQDLISRTVPVIAAAGNAGNKTSLAFPSCIPNVTKVGSVLNDASGVSLSGFSNIGIPGNFSGPILLAPGQTIRSSSVRDINGFGGNTKTLEIQGTSQAAPHVAGLYAAVKATNPIMSVADATAWIVGTGSFPVTYALPAPTGTQTYRRIKVPNF
ncbi:S8 family serine peptidase [Ramlibacter sp.]|uniref:S8 family peptidase n=1 Tax=Ramlibacter sp. TaxID=1917967 RepID=UPI00185C888E|nr:S8 family serine peptidase [Ramlibacter sp.]MBA2672728.1 S8 family serine peptidase [Ramlibacter sp.]